MNSITKIDTTFLNDYNTDNTYSCVKNKSEIGEIVYAYQYYHSNHFFGRKLDHF